MAARIIPYSAIPLAAQGHSLHQRILSFSNQSLPLQFLLFQPSSSRSKKRLFKPWLSKNSMTEKHYGGASSAPAPKNQNQANKKNTQEKIKSEEKSNNNPSSNSGITKEQIERLIKAGDIAKKAKHFARELIKPNMPLLEIAEKIEAEIIKLGGKPAFPVNLSINEIAAHATPAYNDEQKAHGLLKVDLGVHIEGFVADTALSIDLENSVENKKLIETAEHCLQKAIEIFSRNEELKKVGEIIEKTAKSANLQPIINLSGHSIDEYNLHSGLNVPNYNNNSNIKIEEGVYAIEPFITSGAGKVIDGKSSGIYSVEKILPVRDNFARELLAHIIETYKTLPFCSRWLVKKFGTRALIAIKRLEESGSLHSYAQLVEQSRHKVAQAEHTIIITKNEKVVTT